MKTNTLNRKAVEHLQNIGYKLTDSIDVILDAPFLLLDEETQHVSPCLSANKFREYNRGKLLTQEQVLKLRPINEIKDVKKLDKKEQSYYKLLKLLNNSKNSKITGYDVSWTIQECKNKMLGGYEILPISPHACGSISMKHLEIILNFAKEHQNIFICIGYTNYSYEKERYGTYTPCVRLS